jgi:hypothetical protein
MKEETTESVSARINLICQEILAHRPQTKPVPAPEALELPPSIIAVDNLKVPLPGGLTIEISHTRPAARPPFEWLTEITLASADKTYYKHYLTTLDGRLVEAIRKDFFPVSATDQAKLIEVLDEVQGSN